MFGKGNKSEGGHVHLADGVNAEDGEKTDMGVSGSGVDVSAVGPIVSNHKAKRLAKALRNDPGPIRKK